MAQGLGTTVLGKFVPMYHLFHLENRPGRLLNGGATDVSEALGPRVLVRTKTPANALSQNPALPLALGLSGPKVTYVTSLATEVFYSATYFSGAVECALSAAHSCFPCSF